MRIPAEKRKLIAKNAILEFFLTTHLKGETKQVAKRFEKFAFGMANELPHSPIRTEGFWALLRAKDAFVRALFLSSLPEKRAPKKVTGELGEKVSKSRAERLIEKKKELTAKNPTLKLFQFSHLPDRLKVISKVIAVIALQIAEDVELNSQSEYGYLQLLVAKDCFVRAASLESD